MTSINESGRKKLVITKLLDKRKVGEVEVQDFTAKVEGEEASARYGAWSAALREHIKEGATIDCDVVTKKSDKTDPDGNPYWNRKVTQIYIDGKPVIEFQGKGFRGYPPKDSASIEAQVAIKEIGECWRTGKLHDDDILVQIYRAWLFGRLPRPPETPRKEAPKKPVESKDTGAEEKVPQQKDAKVETTGKRDPASLKTIEQLAKALKEDFGLTYQQQWAEINIKSWRELAITPEEAYKVVAASRK